MLKGELRSMYVGVLGFYIAYFGEQTSKRQPGFFFEKCQEGGSLLYSEKGRWRGALTRIYGRT
jgi:hypothetical protein